MAQQVVPPRNSLKSMARHLTKRWRSLTSHIKWSLVAFLSALALVTTLYQLIWTDPVVARDGESIDSSEHVVFAQLVETAEQFVRKHRQDQLAKRDAHANSHGCVTGMFRIPTLPPELSVGLFAKPAEYPVWIRFSNGTHANDTEPDGRGMAVKLMLPGNKVQDFVMVNHHTFFLRNPKEYLSFFSSQVKGDQFGYFIGFDPFKWHLRELRIGLDTLLKKVPSPISTTYSSMLPFKFGEHYIKYSAKPCDPHRTGCELWQRDMPADPGPYYLREALVRDLRPRTDDQGCPKRAVTFQLRVQLQKPGANMPIEDASIEWQERLSPYLPVAEIDIYAQRFDSPEQNEFCENLAFTPWDALPEHQPVGGLNRARKVVYDAISELRHELNGLSAENNKLRSPDPNNYPIFEQLDSSYRSAHCSHEDISAPLAGVEH